jgi:hypothetical protein
MVNPGQHGSAERAKKQVSMSRKCSILLIFLALVVGAFGGFFVNKSKALADTSFWTGTAKGMIAPAGTVIQSPLPVLQVSRDSTGNFYFDSGTMFDLKDLQPGQQTSLDLYVRNNGKKRINVYPSVTNTPNVEVITPLGNANLYPGGWAQFVFQVRAVDIGPYKVSIEFNRSE